MKGTSWPMAHVEGRHGRMGHGRTKRSAWPWQRECKGMSGRWTETWVRVGSWRNSDGRLSDLGLLFLMWKVACATTCLWDTYILKERDVLSYLTWCAWCCCLQGEVCWSGRSSKCVSGHYPQAVEVWCWELYILYQPLNLKIFSTSVYHYFIVKGKETNIRLDEKNTQNVKEGSLCTERNLTGDLLPRVKRKWKPCPGD